MKKIILWIFLLSGIGIAAAEEPAFVWEDRSLNLPDSPLRAFAVDPHDPQQFYVATAQAVWCTRDGGKKWERLTGAAERKWTVPQEVETREVRTLAPFLSRGDGKNLFAPGAFEEEIRRRLYEESVFSGSTFVVVHPENPLILYVGTFDGILMSADGGKSWEAREMGTSAEERVVLHLAVSRHDPRKIFAATMDGLFVSRDGGKSWKKQAGLPLGTAVSFVLEDQADAKKIWLGTVERGVLATSDGGKRWEENAIGAGGDADEVRAIAIVEKGENRTLFAATARGLYCREEREKTWLSCGQNGALGDDLNWVVAHKEEILVAGERGLFRSVDGGEHFRQESVGLRFADARQASLQERKMVFLAPQGLFRSQNKEEVSAVNADQPEKNLLESFRHEPTVQEVQRVAMRFAETHPEKIRAWRRGAKWRALLPKFELGFAEDRLREKSFHSARDASQENYHDSSVHTVVEDDQDTITTAGFVGTRQIPTHLDSTTRHVADGFDSSQGFSSDADESRERNTDLEIGAVWDLGNLLYNPEEVDISKEARELAELRDNILKEVTQYYFRRRHLQLEILSESRPAQYQTSDTEVAIPDPADTLRRELELQELTAQLDALTGGWFSQQIAPSKLHS